jgi:hypothetical protein
MTKELEYLILYLIKKHKDEIIKDADWWFGLPEYWVNVHDYFENNTFLLRNHHFYYLCIYC